MELSHILFFLLLFIGLIAERLEELISSKRNSRILINRGGIEFGAKHYPIIVLLHSAFFISIAIEFIARSYPLPNYYIFPLLLFITAQLLRLWVRQTMKARWTTHVIVIPLEKLIPTGPFRYFDNPVYMAVAMELFSLPLIFGLFDTCVIFSILNAVVLLFIRIPCEQAAIRWSQSPSTPETIQET